MDVATAGERFNRCLPAGEHLVALAGIAADANWPTDMIEHDLALWECTGERGQFVDLRVVEPGIVAEAEPAQDRETLAKGRVPEEARGRVIGRIAHAFVTIPGAAVADAAEAIAGSPEVGFDRRRRRAPGR